MAFDLTIAGTSRKPLHNTLKINFKLNARTTGSMAYLDESGAVSFDVGQEVFVYADDGTTGVTLFGGTIDHVSRSAFVEHDNPTAQRYEFALVGWEQRLDKRYTYDHINQTVPVYTRNFLFTANDATDVLTTDVAHGRAVNDPVRVKAAAGSALPGGLAENTDYYVQSVPSSTTLKVSATLGGSAVNITDTGTGRFKLLTMTCGEIVHALITDFAAGEGITHLTANIKTGAVVDKLVLNAIKVSDALDQLASMSGFVWYIDVDKALFFVSRAISTAPFSLNGITSLNYRNLRRETAREDKFNNAIVRVSDSAVGSLTDPDFLGDGSTREWDLAELPQSIVSMKLDGVDVTFGIDDVDTGQQYYWLLGETKIRQDAGETILTGANHLVIEYHRLAGDITFAEDGANVSATASAEGGSGRYQRTFDRTDGTGVVQAYNDALSQIAIYKANAEVVTYETDYQVEPTVTTARPGQLQTITNTFLGVSSGWLIDAVDFSDVDGLWVSATIRTVSGTYLGTFLEYWKSLVSGAAGSSSTSPLAGSTGGSGGTVGASADGWTVLTISAGHVSPDCDVAVNQYVELAANITVDDPANKAPGKRLTIRAKQDATGDRTITWDSAYKVPAGAEPSYEANTVSVFEFVVNAANDLVLNSIPTTGLSA